MLRDTQLNPAHCKHRSDLQNSTARALTLGNDITAYGHDVQFVEDTIRTYSNLPSLTKQTAIYPAEHLLVNLTECYGDICDVTFRPRKPRLSDKFINTPENRRMFGILYAALRARGMSRREIIGSL